MKYKTSTSETAGSKIHLHVEKVKLRLWTYRLFKQETVLDLFAGMGGLSEEYAKAGCEKLICVEEEKEYFEVLKRRLSPYLNTILFKDNNLNWLREELPKTSNVSYVDFDPFGCPNEQIQLFFENYPVDREIIVNVTDGVLLNLKRLATIDLNKFYLLNLYPKGRLPERDFKSKRNLRYVLPELQRIFIHLLAMKYGFNTTFLYHAMNREANVTYYGLIVYPESPKVKLPWVTGRTPTIRYASDEEALVKTLLRHIKKN